MKNRNIGFGIISSVSCVLIILGIFRCMDVYQEYQKGRDEYTSLKRRYVSVSTTDKTEKSEDETEIKLPSDVPEPSEIDWAALEVINTDIVAWIQIPALDLSYPVLQGKDNDYYLHRDFYKEYLYAGSIFLDGNNNKDFLNYNSIIYGHNMLDGSMFASLKSFNAQEILDKCHYFWVLTPEKQILYDIFSVHEALADSDCYVLQISSPMAQEEWLKRMKLSSCVDTTATAVPGDRIVTLSTCTNNGMTRQVVQGKQIAVRRVGEENGK